MSMLQSELFPNVLRLVRSDRLANMHRYYAMQLQPDLFGGCSLIREWGRIGSGGQLRCQNYRKEGEATNAMIASSRPKQRKGYRVSPTMASEFAGGEFVKGRPARVLMQNILICA